MKTINSLKGLDVLQNNSTEYKGKLTKYQQRAPKVKKYTPVEQHRFTSYQNSIYKKALFGLNMYSHNEVQNLHWKEKGKIKRINRKAQNSINLFKQEKMNDMCDKLFGAAFPESRITKSLSNVGHITDVKFTNTLDLKFLGITKEDVIKRFVNEGILPANFYKLTKAA